MSNDNCLKCHLRNEKFELPNRKKLSIKPEEGYAMHKEAFQSFWMPKTCNILSFPSLMRKQRCFGCPVKINMFQSPKPKIYRANEVGLAKLIK